METFGLKWHEHCFKNSINYEQALLKELQHHIDSAVSRLNEVAYDNFVSKFQIDTAKHEKKERFSEKYKLKLAETKCFFKDNYSVEIKIRNAPEKL